VKGNVIAITGASKGIGAELARQLAAKGAKLVLAARNEKELEAVAEQCRKLGASVVVVRADVAVERDCQAIVAGAATAFGRLDVLVNNAAVRDVSPIDTIDLATWRRITGIILDGAFICAKACIPALRTSGAGAIVNIGGMSGHTGAAGRPHVIAAKLGLVGLTHGLAHDLAPDGITVNCVVPGLIDTERGATAGKVSHRHGTLLGRKGKPEEVAAVVRLLAGPDGRFVTGQEWHVNGGAYLG
jgi:3-oxoacyl-[acyl-carrier protein] reductase